MTEPLITPQMRDEIASIRLREDVTVHIHGIPHDLTPNESEKISNVVLALAQRVTP